MQHRTLLRTVVFLGLASAVFSLPLFAQDRSTDSVAEAARQARAQKKAAAKPATVVTDDTLKPAPATGSSAAPSADGTPAAPTPDANAAASSGDTQAAAAPTEEEEKKKQAEIEALKQEVAAKQAELDLAQREATLDNEAYYSKANYLDDKAGAEKLASEQTTVNQKKDELAALNAKLADLGFEAPPTPTSPPKGPTTLGPPRP